MKKELFCLLIFNTLFITCESPLKMTKEMKDTTSRMEVKTGVMPNYVENTNLGTANLGIK